MARRTAASDAITFDIREAARLADEHDVAYVRDLFFSHHIVPGSWGLPVAIRQPEGFAAELAELPRLSALAAELGCPRATTGVMPGSDERGYDENFAWHVERLRLVAEPLRAAGCRLGIEFIGPKTFRAPFAHEFVHTLSGVQDLARAVGVGNVGVLLDAWHLYASGGSVAEIDGLTADEVVVVHVNDAPAGIARDDQVDNVRALPLETGVLELVPFMTKLAAIGFDGPVMPEPFSRPLNDLAAEDPDAAVRATADAMDALWRAAGLG